jgi:uncharacterized SAM-binding protein YcdF (DUF218 family)
VAIIVGCLPTGLVVACYWQQGFVAAGRCATGLVMPASVVWMLLLAAAIWFASIQERGKAWLFAAGFLAWTVLGNGYFNAAMFALVESPLTDQPHPALEKRTENNGLPQTPWPLDTVVSLGGSAQIVFDDFAEVTSDGERIVSAAQAYHAGATRTIITTGTSTNGLGNPSKIGKDLLISLGVPEDRIFEIAGQNTRQEMQALAQFLANPPRGWLAQVDDDHKHQPVIGLITSAFHMPRAMRLANAENLELLPLPCAFRVTRTSQPFLASQLVPTAGNLDSLSLAIKELMAKILGR